MTGPRLVSDEERVATDIRSRGVTYICDALRSNSGASALQRAMDSPIVRQAVVDVLRQEGSRLLDAHKRSGTPASTIGALASPLGDLLRNSDARARLRGLMTSGTGNIVLNDAVRTREGDFLVLGYLFNAPSGMSLVGRMLLSEEGRTTVARLLVAATYAPPDPYYLPRLPPFRPTADGRRFRESFSSDSDTALLRASLSNRDARVNLRDFFRTREAEARSILRDVLSTPEGVERVRSILVSDQGREFLSMIGGDMGRRIAGDDLWNTAGGRMLVRGLLASPDGMSAIFSLITGF